jgi:hypothetical protein
MIPVLLGVGRGDGFLYFYNDYGTDEETKPSCSALQHMYQTGLLHGRMQVCWYNITASRPYPKQAKPR